MRLQRKVGICRVSLSQIWLEVIESAIVSLSNESDPFQKPFGMDGVVIWCSPNENEAFCPLDADSSLADR